MTEWIVGVIFTSLFISVCLAGVWWSDWEPKRHLPPVKASSYEDPRFVKKGLDDEE